MSVITPKQLARRANQTPASVRTMQTRGTQTIAEDIKIPGRQYDKLLQHIVERLELSHQLRSSYLDLFRYIDREYNAYLLLDAEDKKREKDNVRAKGLKPTDVKLSMIFSQLDEALTYFLMLLAPDEAIYSAIAPREQQKVADGFATLMNTHAEDFGHYRNLALFLLDTLKYNFGAFGVHWRSVIGNRIVNTVESVNFKTERNVVKQGNELFTYDPYNLLIDPSINPINLSEDGEYFAFVELDTPFRLKKMQMDEGLQNVDDFLKTSPQAKFWETHPETRSNFPASDGSNVNWVDILSARNKNVDTAKSYERTTMFINIIPQEFGLSKSKEYEIWRFQIGLDSHILHAKHMDNAHGLLPINVAMPYEDHFGFQSRGAAERLIPHQTFSSFVLNTHQRAVRKKLYGLTVYDENIIPLMGQSEVDLAGGKIPANTQGQDFDLRKKIVQFTDGPDTTRTLENVEAMSQLMQEILPTNLLRQVAGLERATQYQAAAVVQGANRRNLKLAKVINSQAMDKSRHMQMFNIFQFQPNMEILSEETGELIRIDPKQFRDTLIRFTISDGLKGLDRLSIIIHMKEMINTVVQSQQASQQADIMALLDYLSTLFGDHTDFTQFKIKSPIDTLPKEQRDLAFQLLQAALQKQQENQQTQQTQEVT